MVEGHVPARGWGFKFPFAHRRRHRKAIVRSAASGIVLRGLDPFSHPNKRADSAYTRHTARTGPERPARDTPPAPGNATVDQAPQRIPARGGPPVGGSSSTAPTQPTGHRSNRHATRATPWTRSLLQWRQYTALRSSRCPGRCAVRPRLPVALATGGCERRPTPTMLVVAVPRGPTEGTQALLPELDDLQRHRHPCQGGCVGVPCRRVSPELTELVDPSGLQPEDLLRARWGHGR